VPTRVLVEGADIETVLEQIRAQYGPGARIVSADKVRSGGVAGFFAKQHYEIAVEVDDEAAGADAAAPPAALAGGAPAGPVTLLDLVEARRDGFDDPDPAGLPPRANLVSTRTAAFADVMAGLRAQGLVTPETAPEPTPAPVEAATGDTVRPFRPAVVAAGSAPVVPVVPTPPALAPPPAVAPSPSDPAAAPATVVAPVSTVERPAAPARPWTAGLLGLGLPQPLADKAAGVDPYRAVLAAFSDAPEPPTAPGRAGDIFVLVGDVARAMPLAHQEARTLRLDPDRVLLAAAHDAAAAVPASVRITGARDAERRARRLHRDDTPHVVVVDAPIDDTDPEWVRDVCDALGATAVWAVVDATRKTADTARHLAGFGKVDALAVYATVASADPASVLRVGPPVALLDGAAATDHAWAALLSRRLLAGKDRHGVH